LQREGTIYCQGTRYGCEDNIIILYEERKEGSGGPEVIYRSLGHVVVRRDLGARNKSRRPVTLLRLPKREYNERAR
jgi:hypothetical protein